MKHEKLTHQAKFIFLALMFVSIVFGAARRSYAEWDIPSAPTLSSVTQPGCGELTLSWSPGAGPNSGFYISRSTVPGGPYTLVGSSLNTTYTDTGLTNGTTYYYVVQAWYGYSYATSAYSNELSGVPVCHHILPPWWVVHISALPLNQAVVLHWAPVRVDTGGNPLKTHVTYNVYELVAGGSTGSTGTSWVLVASDVSGAGYMVAPLTNGVAYTFAVTANTSENGESALSSPVTVVPGPQGTTGGTSNQ